MGAIAATVGSAVGLGNIWRFPYEAGVHGGGAFLLVYVACVLLMGIPVIVAEFVIGRSTHKNVRGALRELAPRHKLHWFSYVCILASLMIISFYSVVCGWIVEYLQLSVRGLLHGHTPAEYEQMFADFVQNPWRCVLWTLLFLALNYVVLRRGLKRGIERVSNVLMPLLAVLLVVFCVNGLTLPGAERGVRFLFTPDFSQITPRVAIGAMGQAFFSLSLGLSCLLTYASYFKDSDSLVRNATIVGVLDTVVAILAGLMIFPAVFSYGMRPEVLFVASITSTISMSEISIAFFSEEWGMSRNRASILNTGIAMVLGTLCALSFGVLSEATVFGMTLFELFGLLRKRWKFIILLPLIAGIVTAIGAHFLPDEYTASTTMYVLPKTDTEDVTNSVTQSDLYIASMLSNDVSTIMKSSRVRKDVAEQLGLPGLGGYTTNVVGDTNSRVLTLTVTGHDPDMAARVANALVADTSQVAVEVMQIQAVNMIDPAEAPAVPSGPRRSLYVAVGTMAGLFAAICLVIIEDMLDTRVRSSEDAEEIVGVPVIGHFTVVERG